MTDYAQAVQLLRRDAAAQTSTLRHPACQPIFLLHPQPTAKVCLLFHGFTAAPYQFLPLAQALFEAGHNVLVPLLPGHGREGNWGPFQPPPLPDRPESYQRFAEDWLGRSRRLGQQIVVGGVSGGGTLAAWLGLEQPRAIDKTLLLAAYFGGSRQSIGQLTRSINRYQEWLRPVLWPIPQQSTSRNSRHVSQQGSGEFPGYGGFDLRALQVFLDLGQEVLRRSQHEDAPSMLIVSSAPPRAIAAQESTLLFERVLRYQPQTWHLRVGPAQDAIHAPGLPPSPELLHVRDLAHALLSPEAVKLHSAVLAQLARGYIESDLSWTEIAALGNRLARGQAFPAAVVQLGLRDRVSPDLPTVMALLNKHQFLSQHQRRKPAVHPYPLT